MEISTTVQQFSDIIAKRCIYPDTSPYIHNNHHVPRVTSIIDIATDTGAIAKWANSLGFQHRSYTKTLNEAAIIGTKTHAFISDPIADNEEFYSIEVSNCIHGFKAWYEMVTKCNDIKVLASETKLTCPYFGGTFDSLMDIKGKKYLVDFKTSSHIRSSYFLQLAAYRYLINLNYGYDVDGCIILRLDKNTVGFEEMVANLDREIDKRFMDYCLETFFALATAYQYLSGLKNRFDEFKKVISQYDN